MANSRAFAQNGAMDFNASARQIALDLAEPTPLIFGVYFHAVFAVPEAEDLLREAANAARKRAKGSVAAAMVEKIESGAIHVEILERDAMPLPAQELLNYFNDGAEEVSRVQNSTHVAVVSCLNDRRPPHATHWAALATADAAAKSLSGVVFDPQQNHCRKIQNFSDPFPENGNIKIIDHVSIVRSIDDDGFTWVTTMGMTSLGLPNFELRGAPENLGSNFGAVLAGVAQRTVDALDEQMQHNADADNLKIPARWIVQLSDLARASGEAVPAGAPATAGVEVELKLVDPAEGEEDLEQLVSVSPAPKYLEHPNGRDAGYYQFLHELLGAAPDNTKNVAEQNAAMAQASARAKSELPDVKARFLEGLPMGAQFYVKKGYAHDEGTEYMWIFVKNWTGDVLSGAIANDPVFRKELTAGTQVECKESEVYDWLIALHDGSMEGAYTSR
ncbi:MAG: DUF2314 domain-containing protein [Planctomycetes bacterium]|nr:DUF2314 domain-containing protein [Planctomycetota bacterium]